MNFYTRLRRLNESSILLEYNRKDLRNFVGDEYANKFFALRDKLQAPENDLGHWIKKSTPEELKKFIDDWESGAIKSKTQQKKDERVEGAELVFDNKGWKVYHVNTYEAAKQLGSNTTWCITGRYRGYETRGKEFFNRYIKDYNLDGYYFIFDTLNKDHGDVAKYCAGIDRDNHLRFLYNGMQDSEISHKGIPDIPPERRVQPFANMGIELKYHDTFTIKDGVLIKVDDELNYRDIIEIPEGVEVINKGLFDSWRMRRVDLPSTLKEIKLMAFANCTHLRSDSFMMPDSVEVIGKGILFGCDSLDSVIFSDNLKVIPNKTCAYCEELEHVVLPKNVESIADDAFEGCDKVVFYNCNEYAREYAAKHNIKCNDIEVNN